MDNVDGEMEREEGGGEEEKSLAINRMKCARGGSNDDWVLV